MLSAQKRAQKLVHYYLESPAVRKIARMSNHSENNKYSYSSFADELTKLSQIYPDLGLKPTPGSDEFSWFGVGVSRNQTRNRLYSDSFPNLAIFNQTGLKLNLNNLIPSLWKENDLKVKDKHWNSVYDFNSDWLQKESRRNIFSCSHDWEPNCLTCKRKYSYFLGLLNCPFSYRKDQNSDELYLVYLAGYDYSLEEENSSLLKLQ